MPKKISSREAVEKMSRREAFISHGAISARGHYGPADELNFGRMPNDARETIRGLSDIDYVVHSYATPIGVHSESKGWVIPEVKYSPTTSKHQTYLLTAAQKSGRPVRKDAGPTPGE